MVVISFSKDSLLEKILNGSKRQTIRPRNPTRIEQMMRLGLQIYWKQRTKNGYLIHEGEYLGSFPIVFHHNINGIQIMGLDTFIWHRFHEATLEDIAVKDGFNTYRELVECLEEMYGDLEGKSFDVIRWSEIPK